MRIVYDTQQPLHYYTQSNYVIIVIKVSQLDTFDAVVKSYEQAGDS